jgi:transcriptional regulator with XRE-family HTH domain
MSPLSVEHIRFSRPSKLAKLLGVHPATVSRWDRSGDTGEISISVSVIIKAVRLGLSADDFLAGLQLRAEDAAAIKRIHGELSAIAERGAHD